MTLNDKRFWNGNDNELYHRKGGKPLGPTSWIDDFSGSKFDLLNPVCAMDELELETGLYCVVWSVEILFDKPECPSSSSREVVLRTIVRYYTAEMSPSTAISVFSGAYVCANRNSNGVFKEKLRAYFAVKKQGTIGFNLQAYPHEKRVNVDSVIVHSVELTNESPPSGLAPETIIQVD
ncbi:hypothetical protein N9L06_01455 [Mariniblastus sp.]|nr:hypothetical protein [Mariniblastus sp.]